jgi:alpha-tubulin suppressor-like RCC1 family protein
MRLWTLFLNCAVSCTALGVFGMGCSGGTADKPCQPGCVDERTRLECDENGKPHAVKCPESSEPCAASICSGRICGFRPAVGAPCGPDGSARCNAGYACLGPALKLTAILHHTCAVADDGKVWCWGGNADGELGDGTTVDRVHPVLVRGLPSPAVSASAGYGNTCALLDDGHAYCWGGNQVGQTDPTATTPDSILVPALVGPDLTFASIHAGNGHTCAVTSAGEVYCWGNTSSGQCGVDPMVAFNVGPTKIPELDHVVDLETVKNHICAVRSVDPTMVCWGSNQYLEAGGGKDYKLGPAAETMNYSTTPVPVDLGARVVDVGMGFESTYAVTEDGTIYAWGLNLRKQLGIGPEDVVIVPQPTRVMVSEGVPLQGALHVLRSDGSDQCAEMKDASLGSKYVCWGSDDNGELAFGVTDVTAPYAMATVLDDERAPSAANLVRGEGHGCVTVSDEDGVDIECYGQALYCGIEEPNPDIDQREPAKVHWDPEAFASLLE